ncbi:MAG: DUF1737 domain-containing protein [Sulfuricella denitrificans]|nr:DUF1737 domain-containing protein [Sulfuricella denitrificans]
MEYLIFQGFGSTSLRAAEILEREVTIAITNGWLPTGGVSVTLTPDGFILAQAMVKG